MLSLISCVAVFPLLFRLLSIGISDEVLISNSPLKSQLAGCRVIVWGATLRRKSVQNCVPGSKKRNTVLESRSLEAERDEVEQ